MCVCVCVMIGRFGRSYARGVFCTEIAGSRYEAPVADSVLEVVSGRGRWWY